MRYWYQNLDDKLIRECLRFRISISYALVVAKKLQKKQKNSKKHIDIKKKCKEEIERVHDNAGVHALKYKNK